MLKEYQDKDPDPQMISEIFQLINDTIERYTPYLTRIAAEPSYSAVQLRHIRLMKRMISSYLDQIHMSSDTRRIYLDYYVSGILELYFQWYSHETDLTLDEIRKFALAVMKSNMKYFLPGYQIHPAKEYRK